MATFVKIRGLARSPLDDSGSVTKGRGLRVPAPFKSATTGNKATLTPTAGTVSFTARYPGTYGNNIEVQAVVGTLGVVVNFEAASGDPEIVVTAPTTATAAANNAIAAAVNAHPVASQYVVAAGVGAVGWLAVASTNLAGGTGAGTNPIQLRTHHNATVVVDIDDPAVARALRRSAGNYVSLGQV